MLTVGQLAGKLGKRVGEQNMETDAEGYFCGAGDADAAGGNCNLSCQSNRNRGDRRGNKLSLFLALQQCRVQSDKHKLWDKSCQAMGNLLALVPSPLTAAIGAVIRVC